MATYNDGSAGGAPKAEAQNPLNLLLGFTLIVIGALLLIQQVFGFPFWNGTKTTLYPTSCARFHEPCWPTNTPP